MILNELQSYYFWFSQPPTILSKFDNYFGYIFAGCIILCLILGILKIFVKHEIHRKLFKKFFSLALYAGISGAIWYGFRFENTPVLGKRFWVAVILLLGLLRLVFVFKYLIFAFRKEKLVYEKELIKSKYLPR